MHVAARFRAVPCVALRRRIRCERDLMTLKDRGQLLTRDLVTDWCGHSARLIIIRCTLGDRRQRRCGGEGRRGRRDSAAVIVYRFLLVSGVQLQWSQLSHAFFHQSQLYAADDV